MTRVRLRPPRRGGPADEAVRRSMLAYTVRSSGKANVQAVGLIALICLVQVLSGAGFDRRLATWTAVMSVLTAAFFVALWVLSRRLAEGAPVRGVMTYLAVHLTIASSC